MLSPLQLNETIIHSLNVRTTTTVPPGSAATVIHPEPKVTWHVTQLGKSRRYYVFMRILANQRRPDFNRYGYALNLHIWGKFSLNPDVDRKSALELLNLNAPSMLYGIARGVTAQVFAMSYVGKVLLPSLNFVELIKENQRRGRRATANNVAAIIRDLLSDKDTAES